MQHETLTYQADGLTMRSQLFFEPASGRRAGVLVFPEAFGLGEHAISRAERLAKEGFVALACDLHGDGRVVNAPARGGVAAIHFAEADALDAGEGARAAAMGLKASMTPIRPGATKRLRHDEGSCFSSLFGGRSVDTTPEYVLVLVTLARTSTAKLSGFHQFKRRSEPAGD